MNRRRLVILALSALIALEGLAICLSKPVLRDDSSKSEKKHMVEKKSRERKKRAEAMNVVFVPAKSKSIKQKIVHRKEHPPTQAVKAPGKVKVSKGNTKSTTKATVQKNTKVIRVNTGHIVRGRSVLAQRHLTKGKAQKGLVPVHSFGLRGIGFASYSESMTSAGGHFFIGAGRGNKIEYLAEVALGKNRISFRQKDLTGLAIDFPREIDGEPITDRVLMKARSKGWTASRFVLVLPYRLEAALAGSIAEAVETATKKRYRDFTEIQGRYFLDERGRLALYIESGALLVNRVQQKIDMKLDLTAFLGG